MSKKPSQNPVSRGLAVSTAGTACVRANGGDAPVPQRRETLGEEGSSETLPIKEGWGSKEDQGCPIILCCTGEATKAWMKVIRRLDG
jgi:hypothetical protein